MSRKRLNVFGSIAEWRQADLKAIDAIKQIGSEYSIVDDRFEVPVCGRDDANVDFYFSYSAYSEESPRFNRPKKFSLQLGRQFCHLVEKQRSTVGEFDQAELTSLRARKAPAS